MSRDKLIQWLQDSFLIIIIDLFERKVFSNDETGMEYQKLGPTNWKGPNPLFCTVNKVDALLSGVLFHNE